MGTVVLRCPYFFAILTEICYNIGIKFVKKKNIRRECMKISVIMPIYNSAEFLHGSIDSILKQSYKDFEFILIDDGSKDESYGICLSYQERDSRVKAVHIENRGVSGARNYGIELAQGEFVRFVDADDTLAVNSLELLVKAMETEKDVDLVIGKYENEEGYFQSSLEGKKSMKEMIQDLAWVIPSFYYGVTWNKLYRREILEKNKIYFDKGIVWSEDLIFNIEYYRHCRNVYYVPENVYTYIDRPGSLVTKCWNQGEEYMLNICLRRGKETLELIEHFQAGEEAKGGAYNFILKELQQRLQNIIHNRKIKGIRGGKKEFQRLLNNEIFQSTLKTGWRSPYMTPRFIQFCFRWNSISLLYAGIWLKEMVVRKMLPKKIKSKLAITPKYIL